MGIIARRPFGLGMIHTVVKTATIAGLLGLLVLHPDAFGKVLTAGVSTFRKVVTL